MDPAQNYYIKMRYPVYSKEKNSLVVFQFTEKYRDKTVISKIIGRMLLKEDICFIKEKNCIPVASSPEDSKELPFQLYYINRQLSSRDLDS
jgi:hypothetical protein